MLPLGESRTKPHAPPCLWVIAFLVTAALPIYILPIPLYPVASRGELRERSSPPDDQAAASPFPVRWKQVAKQPDAAQMRPRNSCPANPSNMRGCCCRGAAGFETRSYCQSCFSCSKLTGGGEGCAAACPGRAEIGGGGGAGGHCSSVDGAGGHRSSLLPRRAQPWWRVWCLEPPRARRCMAGTGAGAWPLPAAAPLHAGDTERSALCLLPLLFLLREMLVCGAIGSPSGLRLNNPTHARPL